MGAEKIPGIANCTAPSVQSAAECSPRKVGVQDGSVGYSIREPDQLIIATHSPMLLAYPGATIYLFGTISRRVQFRATEHDQVTRVFLKHPDRMLRELTAEDGIDPE